MLDAIVFNHCARVLCRYTLRAMNTVTQAVSVAAVMPMEEIWTVREVAKRMKVSEESVRRLLRSGKLRGVNLGRDWRIPESAIVELFGKPPDDDKPPHD